MKRDDLVQSWRIEHREELDKTLAVLIKLRDDETVKPKDRVDAARSIARMLGSMVPEQADRVGKSAEKPVIKSKTEEDLEELLAKL
jgi:hypothetical protein